MKLSKSRLPFVPLSFLLGTLACSATPTNSNDGGEGGTTTVGDGDGDGENSGGTSSEATGGTSGDGDAAGGMTGQGATDGSGGGVIIDEEDGNSTAACPESSAGRPLLRRLTNAEFKAALTSAFPAVADTWVSTFSSDLVSSLGYTNQSGSLVVTKQNAREIDATAASLAEAVEGNLATILPCSSAADRACAAEYVATYGKRLFRRPVSAAESEALLVFFDEALAATDFPTAIGWLTRSLIHSPQTVYRSEVGSVSGEARALSQYEVVTALSFAFTGETPSDALLARADAGELTSKEILRTVAEELINSPAGREHIQSFFGAWLQYARVTSVTKTNVAAFENLRGQMLEETRRFIEATILDNQGGIRELLTSSSTYPSTELATFYGLSAPASDYALVERPATHGVGVLSQGSLLSTEATPDSSSPTQRGLLVLEKLLCQEPPPPPPDVPPIAGPDLGVTTTRQRYEEVHTASPSCASCHAAFDPIGFGFEHFDEAGRYRADEAGLVINAASQVPSEGATLFEFDGQIQLAEGLAAEPLVGSCASGHIKAFTFGSQAACLGESEREQFISGAIGFIDYLASLASEPHFSRRSLE